MFQITKRLFLLIFVISTLATANGCKKDSNKKNEDQASLKGKWTFTLENAKTYKNGALIYDVDDDGNGDSFLEFTDDKVTYTYRDETPQTYGYTYDASVKRLHIAGNDALTYEVETLTNKKLVLIWKSDVRGGGQMDVYTTTYTR
ncbi:lipocalin family protein [Mucilaginibacter gynuensis]